MEWEWKEDAGFSRFACRGPIDDPPTEEQLALAHQAVLSCRARQNEDIDQWAERIARDVGHLND